MTRLWVWSPETVEAKKRPSFAQELGQMQQFQYLGDWRNGDSWDWPIYLHEWLISMVNVGKYTVRPMDPSWGSMKQWFFSLFCGYLVDLCLGGRISIIFLDVNWTHSGSIVSTCFLRRCVFYYTWIDKISQSRCVIVRSIPVNWISGDGRASAHECRFTYPWLACLLNQMHNTSA